MILSSSTDPEGSSIPHYFHYTVACCLTNVSSVLISLPTKSHNYLRKSILGISSRDDFIYTIRNVTISDGQCFIMKLFALGNVTRT